MSALPATLRPRTLLAAKVLTFAACMTPAVWIVYAVFTGGLGVNPVEGMIRELGVWGLRLLLVTLAITPLRQATGMTWLVRLRRMLGVFSFTYVALHFTAYTVFEQSGRIALIVDDIVERPYILVGFAALMMLLPLAITSTQGWMRRLGKRWKQLHRLVYPAAILAVFHFFMLIKADAWTEPLIYAGVLSGLFGWRLLRQPVTRALAAARNAASGRLGETAPPSGS